MAESELITVARPYARAAFAQALDEENGLQSWSRMLELLAFVSSDEKMKKRLDDPGLTAEGGSDLVAAICGDDLNDKGRNFVSLLAEYGRIGLLAAISVLFELLKANYEKTMNVELTSAFEVSDEDLERLAQALNKRLQKQVNLEAAVDKSLIGGVIIKAEDMVIDNSVLGKLEKLSHALN